MARLHKEYVEFNDKIRLTTTRKNDLINSRKSLRDKIVEYFKEENPDELQPIFIPQGSLEMNTIVNPIPETDEDGNTLIIDNQMQLSDVESFNKGLEELMSLENEVEVRPIKLDDFGDLEIAPQVLYQLEWLLEEN